jgi:uncharacterized membrane protein YraQ (UPF0718 family)
VPIITKIAYSLYGAAGMFWDILWALILGFALSAIVMTFIPKKQMTKKLGKAGIKEISFATFLGAISSSCSYAAAAMGRNLFQKGAHFVPAMAFMLASTNLVVELSVVLWKMMGWQFVAGEFIGGIILVFIVSGFLRLTKPWKFIVRVHDTADQEEDVIESPKTLQGWQVVGQKFVSEWKMIQNDIFLGVTIAGFLMTFVSDSIWQKLFLTQGSSVIENAFIGPIVSLLSFVCSVGNIPLANVLYHGGISFGGALSFIYADLIIIPLILIYKKYYGTKVAVLMTGIFYFSMVVTGIVVEFLFNGLGWIPKHSMNSTIGEMQFFQWNYTTWLNTVFILLAAILYWLSKRAKIASKSCCH